MKYFRFRPPPSVQWFNDDTFVLLTRTSKKKCFSIKTESSITLLYRTEHVLLSFTYVLHLVRFLLRPVYTTVCDIIRMGFWATLNNYRILGHYW